MHLRIIPCLQLLNKSLVKTVSFSSPKYIGDPLNTVRIFNELEVDELCFLDIRATLQHKEPDYNLLKQIADECFMPLSYGGGITNLDWAKKVFRCGFEKIVVGSAAIENPQLIRTLSEYYGTQAIIVAIDVRKNRWGNYSVMSYSGTSKSGMSPIEFALQMQTSGAGEFLLTSINNEGSWRGFDLELIKRLSSSVSIPVIAHGGCGNEQHIREIALSTQAGAVAVGSYFLYQKKDMGVLVNYPKEKIESALKFSIQV